MQNPQHTATIEEALEIAIIKASLGSAYLSKRFEEHRKTNRLPSYFQFKEQVEEEMVETAKSDKCFNCPDCYFPIFHLHPIVTSK